jgi:lysophospholipase L1-like esterase
MRGRNHSVLAHGLRAAVLAACAMLGLPQAGAQDNAPAAPITVVPSDGNYAGRTVYQVQYADYLAWRRTQPADLIFIGDSITEQFRWGPGNAVWKQHYEQRALNFGRSGDRTQHVLWRLDNLDIGWARPKAAILLIGTNNQDNPPEDIVAGVRAIIAKVQAKWPGVKVVLLGILPNGRQTERMAATNLLLPALADGKQVHYLDLGPRFPREGENWKGLLPDRLHLTTAGYETWAAELNAFLPAVLK